MIGNFLIFQIVGDGYRSEGALDLTRFIRKWGKIKYKNNTRFAKY